MPSLPPDPQPYGSAAHPVRQDPTQYIIEVHWPRGVIVVAEIPEGTGELSRLFSLDPLDPVDRSIDPIPVLWARGGYDVGQTIPKNDYNFSLSTTANIAASSTFITSLASTAGLHDGEGYNISGPGIPANATFTYAGGTAGALDVAATATTVAGAVVITTKNWLFQPIALDGTSQRINFYRTIVDSGSITTHYIDPRNVFVGDPFLVGHGDLDAFVDARVALGFPREWFKIVREGDFPVFYNDAGPLCFGECNEVFQVMFPEAAFSESYIINTNKTTSVGVMQIPRGGDSGTGRLLPGYPSHNAAILKAYRSNLNLSFDASFHIVAKDSDGVEQDPVWTAFADILNPIEGAEQQLTFSDPVSGTFGMTFDKDGVVP